MPPARVRRLPALLLLAIVVAGPARAGENAAPPPLAARTLVAPNVSWRLAVDADSGPAVARDIRPKPDATEEFAQNIRLKSDATVELAPDPRPKPDATAELAQNIRLKPDPTAERAPDTRLKPETTKRPRALVPLYVSFGALQALDAATTIRALDRGATEANPALGGIAGNPAALVALKAGSSAAIVFAGERLWRKNRVAAVVLMAALNGAYALVVSHNYRAVR